MYAAESASTDQPETGDRNGPVVKSVDGSTVRGPTLVAVGDTDRVRDVAVLVGSGCAPDLDVVVRDDAAAVADEDLGFAAVDGVPVAVAVVAVVVPGMAPRAVNG